jgi:hypothetical protein
LDSRSKCRPRPTFQQPESLPADDNQASC